MLTVFSVVSWTVLIAACFIANYEPRLTRLIAIACSTILLQGVRKSSVSIVRSYERMEIVSGISVFYSLTRAVLGIALLVAGHGVEVQIWLVVVTSLLWTATLLLVVKRRFASFRLAVDIRYCFRLFTDGLPIAVISAMGLVTRRIDIVMLSMMMGVRSVGLYGVAHRFLKVVQVLPQSFSGSLLPHMAARHAASKEGTRKTYETTVRVSALTALPLTVLIAVSSDQIIGQLFGQEYLAGGSALALRILVWAFCVNVISGPVGTLMIAADVNLPRFMPYAAGIAMLNVVSNILLIPRLGFYGACISAVISSTASFVVKLFWVNRLLDDWRVVVRMMMRPVGAAAVMISAMYWLRGIGIMFTIPLGIAVYLGILIWWGELTRRDISRAAKIGADLGNRALQWIGIRQEGS
jgi:O-antigen/teichoic acid export membrane protein